MKYLIWPVFILISFCSLQYVLEMLSPWMTMHHALTALILWHSIRIGELIARRALLRLTFPPREWRQHLLLVILLTGEETFRLVSFFSPYSLNIYYSSFTIYAKQQFSFKSNFTIYARQQLSVKHASVTESIVLKYESVRPEEMSYKHKRHIL